MLLPNHGTAAASELQLADTVVRGLGFGRALSRFIEARDTPPSPLLATNWGAGASASLTRSSQSTLSRRLNILGANMRCPPYAVSAPIRSL